MIFVTVIAKLTLACNFVHSGKIIVKILTSTVFIYVIKISSNSVGHCNY